MDEKRIVELMQTLDLTREEAIELIQEDEKVDKMTVKETESDLTAEQKQAIKKAKGGAKAVDAFGKKRVVERKADEDKRTLISLLYSTLHSAYEWQTIQNCIVCTKKISTKGDTKSPQWVRLLWGH